MARDALGKLKEASDLDKEATKLRKRDPGAARALDSIAHGKRMSAIKQFRRRPRKPSSTVVIRPR